ncbi:MAG: TetR/AcrR family transcriptional regulator [Elusimicrobiota bacterium]
MSMSRSRPRTEPPEIRRQAILDAARSVLIQKGYQDIRIDDVAGKAKIAKGTLYLYFKDKEDIFAAVLEDVIDRLEARLKALPAQGSARDVLSRLAAEMLDFVDENQDFLIQFSREKPNLCGAHAGTALQKRFAGHLRFVRDRIAQCVKEGNVREHDPMFGSLFFISLVRMFMLQKIMGLAKGPLRPKADQLMELFFHGLGGKKAKPHA